jgi:hypothetical protein
MKRLLILLALAGFTVACGKDDKDDNSPAANPDDDDDGKTGDKDAGPGKGDASQQQGSGKVLVSNAGEECTSASDCSGDKAECKNEFTLGSPLLGGATKTPLEGGYCTATCVAHAECGDDGRCLPAEIVEASGGTVTPQLLSLGGIPLNCLKTCDDESACRDGYECEALTSLLPEMFRSFAGAIGNTKYCLPPINLPIPMLDGGVPTGDGGSDPVVTSDGGTDAGKSDAAQADAGVSDAGN